MSQDWLQGKSAKMWVNEICVKQLIRPNWDVRDAHPGQQPPTFICMCTISYTDKTLEAQGVGKTKKEAEQEAALEMLKNKLEMTPAKLQALNNATKRKSVGTSSSSSLSTSTASSAVRGGGGDGGDVSDTDDAEVNAAAVNPISDLLAICDQQEFTEPEYQDINTEGPPHKRIFTVRCSLPDLGLEFDGRRPTKKVAKRVAAFRVLREVKKRGFKYTPHAEEGNSVQKEADVTVEKCTDMSKEDMARFQNMSLEDKIFNGLGQGKIFATGGRAYCNDKSEKCVQYCVDYAHAFQHLPKSKTLDQVLETRSTDSYNQFGGVVPVLEQIASELGIKLCVYREKITSDASSLGVTFMELKFPFRFKAKVPNKAVVHSVGRTEAEQRQNAAEKAIAFLRHNFTASLEPTKN